MHIASDDARIRPLAHCVFRCIAAADRTFGYQHDCAVGSDGFVEALGSLKHGDRGR